MANMTTGELKRYRSKVGYIQQDPYGAMAPFMNVERILEEPMIINGISSREERLERIHRALEEVKMFPVEDFLPKFPHMLSGGQQQRIVIARAMLLEPKVHRRRRAGFDAGCLGAGGDSQAAARAAGETPPGGDLHHP